MPEIIISFPYKKIIMPRNCSHCSGFDNLINVEVARPSSYIETNDKEGTSGAHKKRVNAPVFLCEKCVKELKNKKTFSSIISFFTLIIILTAIWNFALPNIYIISQEYKGHIAGLIFFALGLISFIIISLGIGIPAYINNKFIGLQILSYNTKRIVIRFYNMDFANKFFDLNDISPDQIIKKKD
ncbi:hypothetical protein HZA55_00890 [Candidatus Poribacteria bacterium]|nr:hypothetical protein [Candidatus Poribacteria bacterium]